MGLDADKMALGNRLFNVKHKEHMLIFEEQVFNQLVCYYLGTNDYENIEITCQKTFCLIA